MSDNRNSENGRFVTKDETGNVYSRLTVVGYAAKDNGSRWHSRWKVKCECGVEKIVSAGNLRKGHVRSCGCLQRELASARQSKPGFTSLWNSVIYHYKVGAKKRALVWDLTRDQAIDLMKGTCHYCDASPANQQRDPKGKVLIYNGIDRIHNDQGYTVSNTVTCCKNCNLAKNKMTYEAFIDWINRLTAKMARR